MYFGDNVGNVNIAYAGSTDLTTAILGDAQCAFNTFGDPGKVKNATMIRPLLVAAGNVSPTLSVDVDFDDSAPSAPIVILAPSGGIWDISTWDVGQWSGGTTIVKNWLSVNALGTYLAVRLQVNLGGASLGGSNGTGSIFDTGVFDTMVFDGNGAVTNSGQLVPTLQVNAIEMLIQGGGPI